MPQTFPEAGVQLRHSGWEERKATALSDYWPGRGLDRSATASLLYVLTASFLFWASGILPCVEGIGVSSYLQLWLQGLYGWKNSEGETLGPASPDVSWDLVCDRESVGGSPHDGCLGGV